VATIKDEKVSYWKLLVYIWTLSKSSLRFDISSEKLQRMRTCFEKKQYDKVIAKVLGHMNLKTRVSFRFIPDNELSDLLRSNPQYEFVMGEMVRLGNPVNRYIEPGNVQIQPNFPIFGSESFQSHVTRLSIGESMRFERFESFLSLVAHELRHICLFSRYHSLRQSEIATDLDVLLNGYCKVYKNGRKLYNGRLGYLSDSQFAVAFVAIRFLLFFKRMKGFLKKK
jgi:hypothetical protein